MLADQVSGPFRRCYPERMELMAKASLWWVMPQGILMRGHCFLWNRKHSGGSTHVLWGILEKGSRLVLGVEHADSISIAEDCIVHIKSRLPLQTLSPCTGRICWKLFQPHHHLSFGNLKVQGWWLSRRHGSVLLELDWYFCVMMRLSLWF